MNEYTDRICGCDLPPQGIKGKRQEVIDLTIGIFFDGTLNNKYNLDYAKKTGKAIDDSYKGSYSNVAELYECYETSTIIKNIYVEGIGTAEPNEDGTSSEKRDSSRGYIWGTADTGINAKVERGCELMRNEVDMVKQVSGNELVNISTLTLDVFGFSRGAAAARSFVSQIEAIRGTKTESKNVSLRQWVTKADVPKISVRFLGLFDTVSSFSPGWNFKEFENDVPELALTIPQRSSNVYKAVHLVAADEYRENFALTTIDSAGTKGKQIILPGAHSDIGGGYAVSEGEEIIMYYDRADRPQVGEGDCRGYMSLQQLYDEKWIPLEWDVKSSFLKRTGSFSRKSIGRYVKNDYAKIPLKMMGMYANNEGECFSVKLDKRMLIPNHLTEIKSRILSIVDSEILLYKIHTGRVTFIGSDDDLSKIRNIRAEYLHLSARNNIGHGANSNNERKIINDH